MDNKLPWGTAAANWGDVLCSLGYFQQAVGEGNIIYYGPHPEISEFLACQPFVHEVKAVQASRELFVDFWFSEVEWSTKDYDWKPPFLHAGISEKNLVRTHLHRQLMNGPIVHWGPATLPERCRAWASEMAAGFGKPFYLLQPFSFASTPLSWHWPHWKDLMQELIRFTNSHYMLIGRNWKSQKSLVAHPGAAPNLTDLVGQIPSNMHLFALAEKSAGIITTSNSLAHWAHVQSIPCVVLCNRRSSDPDYFFRRILEHPMLTVLHEDATLQDAENAVRAWGHHLC